MGSNPTLTAIHMYVIYILECADGTLYSGITTDLPRRVREHNGSARGARYTRSRRPVALVYAEAAANRSDALRAEARLKRLARAEKLAVINAWNPLAFPQVFPYTPPI